MAISSAAWRGRHRRVPDYFIKLAALDEVHAEVAVTVALADFVNWDNAGMVESGGGFCFATKTLQVRFRGPLAEADHFECDGAVEAFLSRAVNYALATPADFLQQFVIAKVTEYSWRERAVALDWSGCRAVGRGRARRPATDSSSSRARLSRRQAGQTSSVAFPAIIAPHVPQTVVAVFIQICPPNTPRNAKILLHRA